MVKNYFSYVIFILVGVLLMQIQVGARKIETFNFMPVPAEVAVKKGEFRLQESFTIGLEGEYDGRLVRYATRTLRRLAGRTGLFLQQDFITTTTRVDSPDVIIHVTRLGMVKLGEDESYSLEITPEKILLQAETDIGALRGLETLVQSLDANEDGYFFPCLKIKDQPRFLWRGLLIDACRHFMPVEVIKRNLDGMAAVKMNVLHWHLTEDQGFRVECKTFPQLHLSGSDGFYYTQDQIKEIIEYAADRGIRVMPEFDMPGHATSWLVAYPELASAPGPYTIERKWGIFDPTMDPTRESTYRFLDRFFEEMSQLFPEEYIHIGGDENNGNQWNANPDIQKFKNAKNIADNHALQSYFNERILKILTRYGKKMVGWDEIFQPDMPKDIVIQSWRGKEALVKAAQQGYMVMLSNGYYIDLIQSTEYHYLNDPLPSDTPLNKKEQKFVLGGEATMWAEYITPETIDSRVWPRTAAIAERLWSPGEVKNVDDMYRRLEMIDFRLEELGLMHQKNQQMMLRRLIGNHDITPLQHLVDVIEPVKGYDRGAQKAYTSYSPLTRTVDAALPDAEIARKFRKLVDDYLDSGNEKYLPEIRVWLNLWRDNHERLVEIIRVSPVLKEIESLSADLQSCASIGLAAISYIQNKTIPDDEWLAGNDEILARARQPRAQTELMIVSAIEKLIKRTSEK